MSNEYDVTQYSDEECYQMLELDNPTDRVLEMKILQMMDKYETKSKRLFNFFEAMYDRFFAQAEGDYEADDQGDYEDDDQDDYEAEGDYEAVEGFKNKDGQDVSGVYGITGNTNQDEINQVAALENNKVTTLKKGNNNKEGTLEVNQVDYVKGTLNPVERKTIFKMISIDSQFRDDPNSTIPTSFTMNLSEAIDNVISMKLYSVQIPYTWYTINGTFGSNFFYIKGNSPGINNGNHDIKVEINSGTYKPEEIVTAINNKLSFLKDKAAVKRYIANNTRDTKYNPVLDMSLGTTQAYYNLNANNAKVVFEIDLKKQFDETNYTLDFPSTDIPTFLGFNYNTYYPFTAYSISNILPKISEDTSTVRYTLDSSNNYFTVRQYVGMTIIQDISISFSLQVGASYSRSELLNDLNNQIKANQYLDPIWSNISRVDINDVHSQIQISIKLNRNVTEQVENSKLQIIFPNETIAGANHIWTGNTSCFVYPDNNLDLNVFDLNEIISETPASVTNYVIDLSSAEIKYECIKPDYDVSENTISAYVPQSDAEGYLLADYVNAINSGLRIMNDTTRGVYNQPTGQFNISIDGTVATTKFDIFNNRPRFQNDITREFTQSSYYIDLSSCFLSSVIGFDASYHNLTDNSYTVTRTVSSYSPININNSNNRMVVYPKQNPAYGNQNADPFIIDFSGETNTVQNFLSMINTRFQNFIDADGNQVMNGCSISFSNNTFTLVLRISKILTEKDFKVTLIGNSWANNLFFNTSYVLDPSATFLANADVSATTLNITSLNNKFKFKPFIDGVASSDGANDIVFTIADGNYTRDGLINTIQAEFLNNPLTNGSIIEVLGTYIKIKFNVNKKYTAKDYKLVFYDSVSFVYCNVGVTQNVTWDLTLGWLMGFHSFPEYALGDFTLITEESLTTENYKNNVFNDDTTGYVNSVNGEKIAIIGNTVLNTNLYNYFLVVLEDFIQNHVNAGLITITSLENDLALPSYAVRATYQCDPITGQKIAVSATNKLNTNLNSKQLYAMNQIVEAKRTKTRSYASGPYLKDVFALIPMKLTGMTFGQTYMEFGGTMQNQDRKYFGPVRIQKLSVKLMNDKGALLDLNGANWSFCIICEVLNKQT
jgi:hypothetical protein